MSYEVGQFYKVPCVQTKDRLADGYKPTWHGEAIPVMGPLHRDAGAVNYPWLHWHVDLRFVSARVFKALCNAPYSNSSPYSMPLQKYPHVWAKGYPLRRVENMLDSFVVGDVHLRRLKCKREFPAYPISKAKWMPALQKEMRCARMENMVCPHRGISLEGAPRDGDVVTCPGHGLRWNVKTGCLVSAMDRKAKP